MEPIANYKRNTEATMDLVHIEGERYFKINDVNAMKPFFMSMVNASDMWMFIGSTGGLTCGRRNTQYTLFPYYSDDKVVDGYEHTGSKTIIKVDQSGMISIWEPFSKFNKIKYNVRRHLYKSALGDKLIFEEVNYDLGVGFSYQWSFSEKYGFVRKAKLVNIGNEDREIEILDGVQNIVPYGVSSDLQNSASNLVDAYKRSELDRESGLGIFALSAIITDKAEPSEALLANVVYQIGLSVDTYLLSSLQLDAYRNNTSLAHEHDVKGEKGAYFVESSFLLKKDMEKTWLTVCNTAQTQSQVIALIDGLSNPSQLESDIKSNVAFTTQSLRHLVGAADGFQATEDNRSDIRHYANVLFNIMRGGIFDKDYQIDIDDFWNYAQDRNKALLQTYKQSLSSVTNTDYMSWLQTLDDSGNADLYRIGVEYLPLKFSRRHGDPSRPWNAFDINIRNAKDGSRVLDYQGNWRDIFQNWEALVHAYPFFIKGMITRFLNATTFEGYNPYRVVKDGYDWEVIEPDDPWSYIGYWGDHQIIYLLKFLEFAKDHTPEIYKEIIGDNRFVYAQVPYRIKSYDEICQDPKDTIVFDHHRDVKLRKDMDTIGTDATLERDSDGNTVSVHFIEKILATTLAKISNFVIDGGIWLNTQRPEWNDANNALVGNGTSMVTLYYIRRFLLFFNKTLKGYGNPHVMISGELAQHLIEVSDAFKNAVSNAHLPVEKLRKQLLDACGRSASNYREAIYASSFSGKKGEVTIASIIAMVDNVLLLIDRAIDNNERPDHLYHGYNIMTLDDTAAVVDHLPEMLEGQVAVLSSGKLSAKVCLQVLDAMRNSALYREDQDSFLLYPDKNLPGFLTKNNINAAMLKTYGLEEVLPTLLQHHVIEQDLKGNYHFNGSFRNARLLEESLANVPGIDVASVKALYESIFNHKAFTGRSGTFFGYEGLGSIYWHMVSKLRLAVIENCQNAHENGVDASVMSKLVKHYYQIVEGIGAHKDPSVYGAFPNDPYSHTPKHRGAQQPGMTGQVKEDILSRWKELGIKVQDGCLIFEPFMLRKSEFCKDVKNLTYVTLDGQINQMEVQPDTLVFTYCQVPVVYRLSDENGMKIYRKDGSVISKDSAKLDESLTKEFFARNGAIERIEVNINDHQLLAAI